MTRRSLLTSLLVLIATASLAAPPPVNPADAAAFMNQLWASAVEVLNKKADPAAREARFRQLFHEDFGGETFKIRSSRSDGDGIIVSTDVFSPGSTSPLRIDWRLVTDNGVYKISDVIVEGVSMSVTQRSEFASVIQRNGGQLRGVIGLMREKTARAAH